MKYLLIYFLVSIYCFSCQQTSLKSSEEKTKSLKTNYSKDWNLQSIKNDTLLNNDLFNSTLSLIFNTSPYSGKRENIHYGKMCQKVYEIVYEDSCCIGINRKIDLLLALGFYQEKYLPAYWSLLLTKYKDGNKDILSDDLTFIAPIVLFENSPRLFYDEIKHNFLKVTPPIQYKLFFEKIIMKINSDSNNRNLTKHIIEYQNLLISQISNEVFRNRYKMILLK